MYWDQQHKGDLSTYNNVIIFYLVINVMVGPCNRVKQQLLTFGAICSMLSWHGGRMAIYNNFIKPNTSCFRITCTINDQLSIDFIFPFKVAAVKYKSGPYLRAALISTTGKTLRGI